MNRLLMILFVMVALCPGCATVETVTPPSFSFKPDSDIPLLEPSILNNVKFIPKNGLEKSTQDNVTVEVSDLISSTSENDYTISLQGPNDSKYNYNVFPMLLILKITNNTNHNLTLERTIVKIEDDKQNDYPLINSIHDIKQQAISNITTIYDNHLGKFKELFISDANDKIEKSYRPKYQQFINEVRQKIAKGVEVRFPETPPGQKLTAIELNNALKRYAPDNLIRNIGKDLDVRTPKIIAANQLWINQASKSIDEKIPDNLKDVITQGVYQPIDIKPGRSERILVPFSKRNEEQVNKLLVYIYDLPTKVNGAGVTTKQNNFIFEMVGVAK